MYHFSCIIYIVLPLLRVSITPYKYHLTQIDILRGLTFTINNSQQFILLIVYCSYSNLCALVVKLKGLTSMIYIYIYIGIMNAKTFHYFRLSKISDVFLVYLTILSVDVPGNVRISTAFNLCLRLQLNFKYIRIASNVQFTYCYR